MSDPDLDARCNVLLGELAGPRHLFDGLAEILEDLELDEPPRTFEALRPLLDDLFERIEMIQLAKEGIA